MSILRKRNDEENIIPPFVREYFMGVIRAQGKSFSSNKYMI